MGQKANAIGLRLGTHKNWEAHWHGEGEHYSSLLHKDLSTYSLLTRVHERDEALVGRIRLSRQGQTLSILLPLYQPQRNQKTSPLQKELLEKTLIQINGVKLDLQKVDLLQVQKDSRDQLIRHLAPSLGAYKARPYFQEGLDLIAVGLINRQACLLAKYFAQQMEKDFRHNIFIDFLKKALPLYVEQLPEIKGLRIQCKGRLNGADRSKVQWFQYGQVAFQTLDQAMDYSYAPAFTPYGVCGIKVWVVYATPFKTEER